MYLEFQLPKDGGYGATLGAYKIAIARWANKQGINYADKNIKYKYRVTFDRDEYYTVFTLTWDSPFEYKIIDIKW
jgi:hypothetical protein